MSKHHHPHDHDPNKSQLDRIEHEVEEAVRLGKEAVRLDEEILASRELTGGHTIQNGGTTDMAIKRARTDNTVAAGTTGNFSAIADPAGSIFPPGATVNFTATDPTSGGPAADISLAPGAPDALGNPTINATAVAAPVATSFILGWSVTRTDSTLVTASPLTVVIAPAVVTGPSELTAGHSVQNS